MQERNNARDDLAVIGVTSVRIERHGSLFQIEIDIADYLPTAFQRRYPFHGIKGDVAHAQAVLEKGVQLSAVLPTGRVFKWLFRSFVYEGREVKIQMLGLQIFDMGDPALFAVIDHSASSLLVVAYGLIIILAIGARVLEFCDPVFSGAGNSDTTTCAGLWLVE